jgi:hypothetical protein
MDGKIDAMPGERGAGLRMRHGRAFKQIDSPVVK